jgi:hypothetical protein
LHVSGRRLCAISLWAGRDIQEKVPGKTDHHSTIVILRDVNEEVHVIEFGIHKLELVPLTHAGVRTYDQNVEATLKFSNGGQNRIRGSRQLHRDQTRLETVKSHTYHGPHTDDQDTDNTHGERRHQLPSAQALLSCVKRLRIILRRTEEFRCDRLGCVSHEVPRSCVVFG